MDYFQVITATPRQLESLIRLSEALAKMRLSEEVTDGDVGEAIRVSYIIFKDILEFVLIMTV